MSMSKTDKSDDITTHNDDNCPWCLDDLNNKPYICDTRREKGNLHYSMCHHSKKKKIYEVKCCKKQFHTCCLFSYLWLKTGSDCSGEKGEIKCPCCRQNTTIYIPESDSESDSEEELINYPKFITIEGKRYKLL